MTKKIAALAIALLTSVGCSSTCKDGQRGLFPFYRNYHSCDMECHPTDGSEAAPCRCSNTCPCWKSHNQAEPPKS